MALGVCFRNILKRIKINQYQKNRQGWYDFVIKCNPELNDFSDFEGERKWLEKWNKWVPGISSKAYRVFSQYIGGDINIVPYEVTDAIVEPILTPFEYREVYNDKNSLGILFPLSWRPKNYLRRINGCYYIENGGGMILSHKMKLRLL